MTATAYLVGREISHSLSPGIYTAAFEACSVDARYELLDVASEELGRVAELLRAEGALGANVTMPYKLWAAQTADELDEAASACGAANLLVNRGGRLLGRNTDAHAIVTLLREREEAVRRGRALLLGAGGAAAAGLWALGQVRPSALLLAARRAEARARLLNLARHLLPATALSVIGFDELDETLAGLNLVINATPLGMHDRQEDPLPALPLTRDMLVYDLVYRRDGHTALQVRALASGAELVDGAGHLFEQAMPTFKGFTGLEPPRTVMLAALTASLGRPPCLWAKEGPPLPSRSSP